MAAKYHAIRGCPFPVSKDARVPLSWFMEQGVSAEAIHSVLHPMLLTPEDITRGGNLITAAVVPLDKAWWLLDELIYRDAIPGPIRRFQQPPTPPKDEGGYVDFWSLPSAPSATVS